LKILQPKTIKREKMPQFPDENGKKRTKTPSPNPDVGHHNPKKWLEEATQLSNAKKYQEVLSLCDKILANDEKNVAALNLKGDALDNLGRLDEAVECYNRVLSINQSLANLSLEVSSDVDLNLEEQSLPLNKRESLSKEGYKKGTALLREKKFDQGVELIDAAAMKSPQHELDYKMGALMVLRESKLRREKDLGLTRITGELKKDLEYYDKILADDPNNERVWNNKGTVLLRYGNVETALKCFEKSIEINPEYVNGWIGRGVALRKKGERNAALANFNKALDLQPENVYAIFAKGCTLLDIDRTEEAKLCFDIVLKIDPELSDAWFEKGNAFYKQGDFEGAIECFNKTLALDPKDSDAWYQKGNTFFKMEKFASAIRAFSNAFAGVFKESNRPEFR